MANIMKKKNKIIRESNKSRIAEKREVRITFRALMVEIVLKGLNTLKTRNEFKPLLPDPF
jgi:hypothetical protein